MVAQRYVFVRLAFVSRMHECLVCFHVIVNRAAYTCQSCHGHVLISLRFARSGVHKTNTCGTLLPHDNALQRI